ncbi:UV DNA damage repair endonuclease UvsE [Cesiribacter andamanensis]|uniref:UV DNA damage endonuclease n=1 Tax=Cesiribacter andamanensis AMV16 TaxID=1279009 RepID=M7NP50_9BACT|nr:UV DNA damage repair endonuclease UvsE [Cesiribacter andamanensis]EMR03505.1 UV DNA damage endonuclease [Cesiribacter andamanensis AMV16]
MIHRIGYACINQTLSDQKISVNRGMIRKTFLEKGPAYAAELIRLNLQDLARIVDWNQQHGIRFYRMSSDMFPWMSEYSLEELPGFASLADLLQTIGSTVQQYNHRISFHPGPFNVLASENEGVVAKTLKELDQHSQIMDLMGLDRSPFYKINIHVGTTLQGRKEEALATFCRNFSRLSDGSRARLTVENDDKAGMYHTGDLYQGIYRQIGIPLVFDFHHHYCHSGGIPEAEALALALSTWPEGILPVVHYSEPKSLEEKKLLRAHADLIEHRIPDYGYDFDVMVEAKSKECALLHYRQQEAEGALRDSLFASLDSLL